VRIPAIRQQQQQRQQPQHHLQQQQQQQYEVKSGNNITFFQVVQTPEAGNNYSLVVYIVNVRPGIEYSVVVAAPDQYVRAAMRQESFPPTVPRPRERCRMADHSFRSPPNYRTTIHRHVVVSSVTLY
jgi:hypothetical protein